MQLGDQNNSFFHRSIKVQNVKNTITHLWDEHSNRVDDVDQIKQVAENFYKKLLGTNQMQFADTKAAQIRQLIPVAISVEQAVMLEKEATAEEIRDTLFHMKASKAPSPNGFSADFFKSAWSIVGQKVVAAIKGLFTFGMLLKEVNATILPMKVNPSAMGNFKPIVCCNVIYKCMTKIISNRMLPLLRDLAGMNQSAFIPSKSIL